jgi:hypothetical protein
MMTPRSLLAVAAASVATLLPATGLAQAVDAAPVAPAAPAWAFIADAAPNGANPNSLNRNAKAIRRAPAFASGLDAMVFNVSASGLGLSRVTRMSFLVSGTGLNGEVANFQLMFFPSGITGGAVVVGQTQGSAWGPGKTTSFVDIDLVAPFDVQGAFSGVFALRVDVNGFRTFQFQPELRSVTVVSDGGTQLVTDTGDLPMKGDVLAVN